VIVNANLEKCIDEKGACIGVKSLPNKKKNASTQIDILVLKKQEKTPRSVSSEPTLFERLT